MVLQGLWVWGWGYIACYSELPSLDADRYSVASVGAGRLSILVLSECHYNQDPKLQNGPLTSLPFPCGGFLEKICV